MKTDVTFGKRSDINNRISILEKEYQDLCKKVTSLEEKSRKVITNQTEKGWEQEKEASENQVSILEQERIAMLEQITSLESNHIIGVEVEQERDTLQEIVAGLETDKQNLLQSLDLLTEERKGFIENISRLENLGNALYLQKERKDMENELANLRFENNRLSTLRQKDAEAAQELQKQIKSLEGQSKALNYLDEKSKMYKVELDEAHLDIEDLKSNLSSIETKNKELKERFAELEKYTQDTKKNKEYERELSKSTQERKRLQGDIYAYEQEQKSLLDKIVILKDKVTSGEIINKANLELSKKISRIDLINKELLEKISILEADKKELVELNIQNARMLENSEGKEELKNKNKELEEERVHLFKIIGKLEEEKKAIPYLDEKTNILEEELILAEKNAVDFKKMTVNLEKDYNEALKKITLLEERRNTRLSLEQDNMTLKKKINELSSEITQLKEANSELRLRESKITQTRIKSEDYKNELVKMGLEKGALLHKSNELIDDRKELFVKLVDMQLKEELLNTEIKSLKLKQKELLETKEGLKSSNKTAYILDREKLVELKEFTLEAIQARRWKSSEFVNGAYDAVGLFYRTLLSDRLIQKKIK